MRRMTPDKVATYFSIGTISSITPLGNGRIHTTYLLQAASGDYVLQKVGPLFAPAMQDIDRVTAHLAAQGLPTPRIIRTILDDIGVEDAGDVWRLMTFITGETIEKDPSRRHIASGAAFIARFHAALTDFSVPFAYHIPHYRDVVYDLQHLASVDAAHTASEKYAAVHPIVDDIMRRASSCTLAFPSLPSRVLHGDLKLNNLRFSENGEAVALLDLDTLGTYPLPLELGDMLRSWCGTSDATIDRECWQAAMRAYRDNALFMTADEWRSIPAGFVTITLSLAARYCGDAYEEKFFRHDPSYPSLFAQNIERARRYLSLLDDFTKQEDALRALHS